jgi:hypothetical protein
MFDPRMYLPTSHNAWEDGLDRRWRRCGYLITTAGRPPTSVTTTLRGVHGGIASV